MAEFCLSGVHAGVLIALQRRAVRHERTVEEEHRELLRNLLLAPQSSPDSFKAVLVQAP